MNGDSSRALRAPVVQFVFDQFDSLSSFPCVLPACANNPLAIVSLKNGMRLIFGNGAFAEVVVETSVWVCCNCQFWFLPVEIFRQLKNYVGEVLETELEIT